MDDKAAVKQNTYCFKPMMTGCIGGIAGALSVGLLHIITGSGANMGRSGAWNIPGGSAGLLADMVVASGVAFLFSWLLYRRETEPADRCRSDSGQISVQDKTQGCGSDSDRLSKDILAVEQDGDMPSEPGIVYSPLVGQVIPMEEVQDDTFAAKVLGEGMAVIPSEGKVYAPFDGKVDRVYDAKHAIAVSSIDGIEILIHVGVNTVDLDGQFCESYVSAGEEIKRGDLLLGFDMAGIKEAGYSVVSPIIVTNSDDYERIYLEGNGVVDNQDILIRI